MAAVGAATDTAKGAGATFFVIQLAEGTDPAALKVAAEVAFKAGVACALFTAGAHTRPLFSST